MPTRFRNSFPDVMQLCSHIPFYQDLSPWVIDLKSDHFTIQIERLNKYELIALGCFLFNLKFFCSKTNRLVLITYADTHITVKYVDSFYNETMASAKYMIEHRYTDNEPYSRVLISNHTKDILEGLTYHNNFHIINEKRDLIGHQFHDFALHLQHKNPTISDFLLQKYLKLNKLGFIKKLFQKKLLASYLKELYTQSSGIVAFTGKAKTSSAFVKLGEDIQNFWIHANYWQISVQPDYIDLLIAMNAEFNALKRELNHFHMNLWSLMNDKAEYQEDILFIARIGYHKNRKVSKKIHKEQQLLIIKK